MKTLFRILIILVLASLIGGLMYMAVNAGSGSSGSTPSGMNARPHPDGDFEGRPEGGEFGGGMLFLPFGMLKNMFIIAVIAVIYFQVSQRLPHKPKPMNLTDNS